MVTAGVLGDVYNQCLHLFFKIDNLSNVLCLSQLETQETSTMFPSSSNGQISNLSAWNNIHKHHEHKIDQQKTLEKPTENGTFVYLI